MAEDYRTALNAATGVGISPNSDPNADALWSLYNYGPSITSGEAPEFLRALSAIPSQSNVSPAMREAELEEFYRIQRVVADTPKPVAKPAVQTWFVPPASDLGNKPAIDTWMMAPASDAAPAPKASPKMDFSGASGISKRNKAPQASAADGIIPEIPVQFLANNGPALPLANPQVLDALNLTNGDGN